MSSQDGEWMRGSVACVLAVLLMMTYVHYSSATGMAQDVELLSEPELDVGFDGPLRGVLENGVVGGLISRYKPPKAELALWILGPEVGGGLNQGISQAPGVKGPGDVHRTREAHQLGYTGAGVRVAVVDTGIDFAQPKLAGTQARVTDSPSPYSLHPLVYDPTSLNDYLLDGFIDDERSWFVNTSYETSV